MKKFYYTRKKTEVKMRKDSIFSIEFEKYIPHNSQDVFARK